MWPLPVVAPHQKPTDILLAAPMKRSCSPRLILAKFVAIVDVQLSLRIIGGNDGAYLQAPLWLAERARPATSGNASLHFLHLMVREAKFLRPSSHVIAQEYKCTPAMSTHRFMLDAAIPHYPNVVPASRPPSTMNSDPVQYVDSSDARNNTRLATSSGRPIRGIGKLP
ncbi:hypothetical protein D9M71_206900 [compost metagenome]